MTTEGVRSLGLRKVVRPVLVATGLALAALAAGFVWVELAHPGDLGPRYWENGASAIGGYLMMGVMALIGLGYASRFAYMTVRAVIAVLRWVSARPRRILRWARAVGRRGVARRVLLVAVPVLMSGLLWALAGFTAEGVGFWLTAALTASFATLMTGGLGAFGLILAVSCLTGLLGRRVPDVTDNERVRVVLGVIGYAVGAATAWDATLAAELGTDAVVAAVPITNSWAVLVVLHLYVATWVGLVRAVRALTAPPPAAVASLTATLPRQLVWHRGGPVPEKPSEEHWSPEPVVAWRGWNWNGESLVGYYGSEWLTSELHAACDEGHPAPEWLCNCGIYALRLAPWASPVMGRVELSGMVVEHEDGYRAEMVRMTELWVTDEDDELVDRLRDQYPDVRVTAGRPAMRPRGV